jgi:23S rRNA (guanosine2251-2'-O)-methyltransferase
MREWITGKNPVLETLKAGRRQLFRVLISETIQADERIQEILRLAKQNRLPIEKIPRSRLNNLSDNHQGVALETSGYPYRELTDMVSLAESRKEPLFVLILDTLQNPQNLGTLLRSAEAFGVHGILLPLRHTVDITPAVVNASSGASEHLLVGMMNLAQAMEQLKEHDVWILGLEGSDESTPIEKVRMTGPLAIVVGSEGEGMRTLVRKSCDQVIRLGMSGNMDSLNAAVAGSIALYLVYQQRFQNIAGFTVENND